MQRFLAIGLLVLGGMALLSEKDCDGLCVPRPDAAPAPNNPSPEPTRPPRRPWLPRESGVVTPTGSVGRISLGGSVSPDGGVEVQIDLPVAQRIRNRGGSDGAGMCVMSSIEMAARWHNLEQLRGLRDWCARQPGGAYPSKVDRQMREYAEAHNIPIPAYINYDGPKNLDLLRAALRSGRLPAVTYSGRDGVRYSGSISHMVTIVHLDDQWAVIMDNNGKLDELIWMTPEEFQARWSGWAVIFLAPPPPPPPASYALYSAPAQVVNVPVSPALQWWKLSDHPGHLWLYDGDRLIGRWNIDEQIYQPKQEDGTYGEEANLPLILPEGYYLTGVVEEQTDHCTISGRPVSFNDALRAVGADIPDDASNLRLTVIGPRDQIDRVLADLQSHPALVALRERLVVQAYDVANPNSKWALDCGFVTTGTPTIYVQEPSGKVLHRQDTYEGPEKLAQALRRSRPDYTPSKDKNLNKTQPVPLSLLLLGGGVALFLLSKKKEQE